MFQRRLDDPSKRRAIQREPGVVFANKTFVLAPDVEQRDTLVTMIAGCEDTMILKRLHKSVNMLVVAAATPFSSKMVLEAHQLGIPVIPSTVMLDAVKSGSFKPTKADMIDTEKAAIEASKAKRLREEEEARKAQAEASKMEEEERKRRKLEEQEKKRKEEEEKKLEEEKKRKIAAEEEKKKLEEKKKSEEKKKLEEKKKAEEKKRAEEYERRAQDEKKRQRQYEDEEIAVSKKATNKSSNSSISKAETTVAPPSKVQEESESDTPKIEDRFHVYNFF
jgi:flagellar biosynthesis GTPase FlhF